MKLSIVVPSFQQGRHLGAALDSLANQRDLQPDELEILVIDGGSSDQSVDLIRQREASIRYWVSEPDRGQTHALRKGFAKATGDVLGWLCSDDLLEPGAVRFVLDYFAGNVSHQVVYGDALWIDESGDIIRPKKEIPFNWFIWKYDHNYIPQPSAFWRRSLYEECGGLNESLNCAMDSDLFAKFARGCRPRHVRRVLSRIRVHPDQKSQRFRQDSIREHREACQFSAHPSRLRLATLGVIAKSMRVTWKLATGCYW